MAAEKTPEQEPSIEEILASIRQIISDDEDKDSGQEPVAPEPVFEPVVAEAALAPEEPAFEPEAIGWDEPEEEEDILELTDPITDDSIEEILAPPIEVDLQEQALPPEPAPLPATPVEEIAVSNPDPAEGILTEVARNATISSMARLAGNMPVTKHREYGNITLEDLVREMLHPMLKDWLSENLPPMVERMVQKELEKLARQAQDV